MMRLAHGKESIALPPLPPTTSVALTPLLPTYHDDGGDGDEYQ